MANSFAIVRPFSIWLLLTAMSGCASAPTECRKLALNNMSLPVLAIIPIGPSEAYLVHTDGLIDDLRTHVTILGTVSTTLGEESLESAIRLPGEYRRHSITDKSVCLAVESFTSPLSFSKSVTSIYRISLKDEATTRLCTFDGVVLREMWFSNDGQRASVLLRISGKETDLLWLTSSDGGVTWNNFPMNQRIDIGHLVDTVLYGSTTDLQHMQSILTEQRANGSIVRSDGVPMAIAAFCSPNGSNEEILCIGSDAHGIAVQSVEGGRVELVHRFDVGQEYFANDIYRFGSFIAVSLGKMDNQMLAGHGGARYEMHVSSDSGESWQRINSGDEIYLEPTGLYHSEWVMSLLTTGHLLFCSIP